jgi:uncharacterized protein YaaW (UPF0174 family)
MGGTHKLFCLQPIAKSAAEIAFDFTPQVLLEKLFMTYDPNLTPLLESCTNEDLDPLVQYLVRPITTSLKTNQWYIKHQGNHRAYVHLIVRELQLFGGHTLATIMRRITASERKGVSYREILEDVADKMNVDYDKNEDVESIETKLLRKAFDDAWKRMDQAQREALFEEFRQAGIKNIDFSAGVPFTVMLSLAGAEMTGFLAYRLAVIVANSVAKTVIGQGLTFATNAALTRVLAIVTGPIGWVITGLWTLYDVAGPAYRVTIPCVLHIAYLRKKKAFEALAGDID